MRWRARRDVLLTLAINGDVEPAVPASRTLADAGAAARAGCGGVRRMQPWQARQERDVRVALEILRAEERAGCFDLVRGIVELAVEDLRSARGRDLESAVLYFTKPDGELVRWHCDVLGLDLAALRQRAQAILAERFGSEAAAGLWARLSRVAGTHPRRRRVRWVA